MNLTRWPGRTCTGLLHAENPTRTKETEVQNLSNPNLQMLLNRLEFIRPTGEERWKGKCPVHGGDNRSTLSIKSCSDGRILLHCFAHQCPPIEILQVCGLEMTHIMPGRLTIPAAAIELIIGMRPSGCSPSRCHRLRWRGFLRGAGAAR